MSEPVRALVAEPLVGRAALLQALQLALAAPGAAILLDGPGGVGKSSLARAAAAHFAEAVWFDASDVSTVPELVALTARALGLPEPDPGAADPGGTLGALLAPDQAPLVVADSIDRCGEDALHVLLRLVAQAPRVRLLLTSRVRFPGIEAVSVPPLPPEAALELFVRAARRNRPGFALGPESRAAAMDLCVALDGLPLGLELAAARVGLLGPAQLRDRLVDRFRLLVRPARDPGDRHASLHAALAWSWDPLAAAERAALARLTAFRAGFDLDAAEAVIGAGPDEPHALLTLERLLAASLLTMERPPEAPGGPRLRLLDSVRAFAAEALPDEARRGARRHAEWVRRLSAGPAGPAPGGATFEALPEVFAAAERVIAEGWQDLVEEVVVDRAVPWGKVAAPDRGLALASALLREAGLPPAARARVAKAAAMCLIRMARHAEAVDHLAMAVEALRRDGESAEVAAGEMLNIAVFVADLRLAQAAADCLTELAERRGDLRPDLRYFGLFADLAEVSRPPEVAATLREEVERHYEALPLAARIIHGTNWSATILREGGDLARAERLAARSVELAAAHGVVASEVHARCRRGDVMLALGRVDEAVAEADRVLSLVRPLHSARHLLIALPFVARATVELPERRELATAVADEAIRLLGAVSALAYHVEARRLLIPTLLRLGRRDEARRLLDTFPELAPDAIERRTYDTIRAPLAALVDAADPRKP